MAKREQRKITVKKPVMGKEYYFLFAGGILKGTLSAVSESLTKNYNENWYKMRAIHSGREMVYPIPQRHLSETYEGLINK